MVDEFEHTRGHKTFFKMHKERPKASHEVDEGINFKNGVES